jgi:PAS domain S-box-containing protein
MIDALADHVAILDEHATIIAVNHSWQRFAEANHLGSPNYGLGLNYLELCESATGPSTEQALVVARGLRRLLSRRQGDFRCDYPCHSPSEKRWFQLWTTCFQDRSHLYLVLSHQNVTEIKQSQQELHASHQELEQRMAERTAALEHASTRLEDALCERTEAEQARDMLAAIVESSQDAIISKDLEGLITSWNASAERLFGYRACEALGQPGTIIIPEDKREEELELVARLRQGEHIEHLETVRLARDGRRIDVALTISPVCDATGNMRGVSKIVHDISARKQDQAALLQAHAELERRVRERTASLAQANEALRNSERRLAIFANATFEGIAFSQNGRFTDVNEQLAKMLGYTREELLGMDISQLIAPGDRARVMAKVTAGLESHVDHGMVRKDGSLIMVEAHGQSFELDGQPTRLTVLLDITERRRLQEALAHFNEELDHLVEDRTAQLRETIEELEHFSYALLHDMRAPLRAMMSFANLIEMQCAHINLPPEIPTYLNRIKTSSERMDHLVRDALNYTRVLRRDFPLRPVPLLPLLQGLIESYPELCPHEAQIHLAPNLPTVMGNEAMLTECFSNLLRNAVKFVAPGQPPNVRLWAEWLPSPPSATAPPKVRIWVEDKGIGIPPEEREAIFTMFRQVHPASMFPGTGIGLAIVRKGLQRIGGRVGVESAPGQGSRFWVELEAARSSDQP